MTTPDPLTEAVARAMCIADGQNPDEVMSDGYDTTWPLWAEYEPLAETALAIARPQIRREALEEAAQVAEDDGTRDGDFIAAAIRALKGEQS